MYKTDLMFDELKWVKSIRKLSKYMMLMDKNKYLDPKFSDAINPLAEFLKEYFNNQLLQSHNDMDKLSSLTTDLSAFQDNKSEISLRLNSNKLNTNHSILLHGLSQQS